MADRFIQRVGIVKRIEPQGFKDSALAYVELVPLAGCAGCERQRQAGFGKGHCGIDLFGLNAKQNRSLIKVAINEHQAAFLTLEDSVDVHIPAPNVQWLTLAFRVYGLPTLGLVAGAAIGSTINELVSITFSVVGCWLGLTTGRRLAHESHSIATLGGLSLPATRIVSVNR